MDPIRQKMPWYDRLSELFGRWEARGASKHARGRTPSFYARDVFKARKDRKAKRKNRRFARAITRNWPRGRKR